MRSESYSSWVCPSVRPCVCLLFYISPLECLFVPETIPFTQRATKVRKYVGFSLKMLRCRARSRKSQYANTQRTGRLTAVWLIRVLCVPRRHQKMQRRRACITSRMLSRSVVSPRQTARAGKRPRVTAKTKPSPSISDTAHAFTHACASQCAEVCTSVLFSG